MKLLRFFFLLVIVSTSLSQNKVDYQLNKPLTTENLDRLDSLIKANAPDAEALNAMVQVSNTFYRISKAMNAYTWMERYTHLFPKQEEALLNNLKQFELVALTQYPDSVNRTLYESYAIKNAPSENSYIAFMRFISDDINYGRWQKVLAEINRFSPAFPNKKQHFSDLIEIITRKDEGLRITNLGNNINTFVSEWDPNPTAEGNKIYFSGNPRTGGLGGDDVWVSHLVDGIWQIPQNLGPKVNGERDETIDNISADGNTLMLSGDFRGTFGKFDIYSIDKVGDDWGDLYHYPYPINTEHVDEGGNITADRKALLFTSDRPGGVGEFVPLNTYANGSIMGNMDIYVCFMTDSGWSNPINLGETINTPYSERSPFLHPDGKSLYFSSDGHAGLGGLDVFKSVRLDDSWTNWSKPVNLGKEINTILNDWGYKIGITGDSAFFSGYARTNGYGQWDLYSVTLPKDARPDPIVMVSGTITDDKGNKLQAEVIWEDLSTGQILGSTQSNMLTGHYFIALPNGKNYGYYVKKNGYYPSSNSIDLTKSKDGDSRKIDIELVSTKDLKGNTTTITVNNIFFDFDSSVLKNESTSELNRLIDFIRGNKVEKLTIIGHTDNVGSEEYNRKLSLERANSVKKFISSKLQDLIIATIGKGASEPIDSSDDSKNRRVEIQIE